MTIEIQGPLRRAQLIQPFGVGAMHVLPGGVSVITCGLDHWYPQEFEAGIDLDEFKFQEWRLERRLRLTHFRFPPDHRRPQKYEKTPKNSYLVVPLHRFPQWHRCRFCNRMKKYAVHYMGGEGCPFCKNEAEMLQSDLVIVCPAGHLSDFPYVEWLHRDKKAKEGCESSLKLDQTFGRLECTNCDVEPRQITRGITRSEIGHRCPGERPWLGEGSDVAVPCQIKGQVSLKLRMNIHYSRTMSSLALPSRSGVSGELIDIVGEFAQDIANLRNAVRNLTEEELINFVEERLRGGGWNRDQLRAAMEEVDILPKTSATEQQEAQDETAFRHEEWKLLTENRDETDLHVEEETGALQFDLSDYVAKVMRVERLCETTAYLGFSRIHYHLPENRRDQLWRNAPSPDNDWLPAIKNYGEGIFLELDRIKLQEWEQKGEVQQWVDSWASRYEERMTGLHGEDYEPTVPLIPRLLLLHTLAHLIIQEMTMTSGYAAASLRERLYVSDVSATQMAGVLIYTAAGDSEGTMGGLVRMAETDVLSGILKSAIEKAVWCSNDPICREMGKLGQGPQGCNLAACYSCALLPETACEHGNRFLDRTVVVDPDLGFFSGLDFL